MDGLVAQLPRVDGDGGDGVGPQPVRHTHLEAVGARRRVLLDEEEARPLVQEEVAKGTQRQRESNRDSSREEELATAGQGESES